MALSIVVRLRHHRYDAAALRSSQPEWPPHPARLFCALVASAREDADWAALRWLEHAGVPGVLAARIAEVELSHAAGWVVTNSVERVGKSQFWPGRVNGYKTRTAALPP